MRVFDVEGDGLAMVFLKSRATRIIDEHKLLSLFFS